MKLSAEKLAAEAESTSFRPDVLEKVAHLLGLLNTLQNHPFLKRKLVLKECNHQHIHHLKGQPRID